MKVLVAMSGGLKSLVTAWLLKKQGMQVRGVYIDLSKSDSVSSQVEALERKLGISIQVVPAHDEFAEFLAQANQRAMATGETLNSELYFHRQMLFPKILELKSQHQFDKVATGHRVLIQEDQVSRTVRVFQNTDSDFTDAYFLLGRTQKELESLIMPLGSIPKAMFEKLAAEIGSDATWKNHYVPAEAPPQIVFDVMTQSGSNVGVQKSPPIPVPGDVFHSTVRPEGKFYFTDVSFLSNQALVLESDQMKVEEIHLHDVAWFSRPDLGLEPLTCGLTSQAHPKVTPVRLLQYEGGRVKAHLNQTLLGAEANIFKGQTVLWVEGTEILGGGRVLGTR